MILERQQQGRVQVLTLNRPDAANSLNPALLDDLFDALGDAAEDDGVQAVVLSGAGERVFCAGMDLRAFSAGGDADDDRPPPKRRRPAGSDMFKDLCAKPVIAAVNGAAVGGGFELVLSCDLVVAAEHARFGLPEVKRGLLAAGGGTLLGTRLPLPLALEVALTGELIDAPKAATWGLVNRVVPASDLMATAVDLASTIAANGPLGLLTTKRLVRRAVLDDPKLGYGTPEELSAVFGSEDAKEGAAAFLEKRPPQWKGR